MHDSKYKKLLQLAENKYRKNALDSHGWDHILRVLDYCKTLSAEKGIKTEILFPACVLHDLGRTKKKEKSHAESTAIAEKLLRKAGYREDLLKQIVVCIRSHSVDSKQEPVSEEAKILFDADKLDSYGAIGLARFFILAGEHGDSLNESAQESFERITKLNAVGGFHTKEAEKIGRAKAKTAFIFYYLLFKELKENGKTKTLENILIAKYGSLKGQLILKTLGKLFN